MILSPDQYNPQIAYEMLVAASRGYSGLDQRFLHAILDEPETSIAGIVRFASEDDEERRIDLEEELVLIARYLRSKELLPFLIACVKRNGDDIPDVLVETVCDFREAALEPLLKLHGEIGSDGIPETSFLLASLGVHDERIEEALREFAELDPDEGAFCQEIYEQISSDAVEPEPFDIWSEFPAVISPPFEVLTPEERLEFFPSDSDELRAAAAASLFHEPELPEEVVKRLLDLAESDPEPVVRSAAWRSLALEFEDEEVQRRMRKRLADEETPLSERAGLLIALAPLASEEDVRKRVLELNAIPETRSAAVEAMWRSGDKGYSTYVQQALEETDPEVREQGVIGVGYLGLVGELGRVKAMFDDPELRPAALMAYSLAIPSEVSPARMRSLYKKIEELAGGLEPGDADLVHLALDNRLLAKGLDPMFGLEE